MSSQAQPAAVPCGISLHNRIARLTRNLLAVLSVSIGKTQLTELSEIVSKCDARDQNLDTVPDCQGEKNGRVNKSNPRFLWFINLKLALGLISVCYLTTSLVTTRAAASRVA